MKTLVKLATIIIVAILIFGSSNSGFGFCEGQTGTLL
jgi:hypothetical protein